VATYETLELERSGPVLRVWLDRPARRNAASPALLRELGDLFLALETEFDVRAVVLGGRGPSFCAGFDRKPPEREEEPRERGARERRWLAQIGRRACRAIEECEALTVARVQGHAIGGGMCFALACDFRVAARDAVFRLPEVELGIPLSWGAVPRLVHEIGAARARELLLLCTELDGARAAEWGVAHRAVAPDALDREVDALVAALLAKPELAVHMTKTRLRGYSRRASLGDATEADGDLVAAASRDAAFRSAFRKA
jgi:enoyl-CoA hydratase/carnithine racemase